MKAMIMAAGVGSRLMPMTREIPKPMIPMGNRPLMEIILEQLKYYGIQDIIANLHYHASVISDHFSEGARMGVHIQYSREKELLGTAGGVKRCQWFLDDTFVIVSGDALTDINLLRLISEHKSNGAIATIALKEVQEVEQFGVVITDDSGRILDFQEKPQRDKARSRLANTGIYIFEPEIFDYIPENSFYDFGKQVFPELVSINAPFYGVTISDYWCDIGNLQAYFSSHRDLLEGKIRIKIPSALKSSSDGGRLLIGENVSIGSNVVFSGNVVIGDGCILNDNAFINNSILWDNVFIGDNIYIDNSIIGSKCNISSGATVNPGAAIPSRSQIDHNTNYEAI